MTTSKPGLDTRLRDVGQGQDGLEKSMAFSAVRRALLGETENRDGATGDLGKYRILARLGAGGMGAVFAAWDPELERRVALKVLTGGREPHEERNLIMREAKAAAQLAHPNVVTVFEVGIAQDRVFLAMEYVPGPTLRAWVDQTPTASARIAVLLQAGRGLAAAHAQGLVHRDFKPDNVLVDETGQAKVVDFGLAQSSQEFLTHRADAPRTDEDRAAPITQTGPRSGTPDYMAPEQLQGHCANARSDQFAFAVTAWELLCGERPFDTNEHVGTPRGRPVSGVPRGVTQALTRALSAAPADRFGSMQALLRELDPVPRAEHRSRLVLGGAGLLSVGAFAWGLAARSPTTGSQCTGAPARLDGIWDDERRAHYAAAFATAEAPDEALWTTTSQVLSDYAETWVAASTDACEATRIRGEQSDEVFTLQNRCLHGRLRSFRALTERLPDLDAAAMRRAPDAARALPSIEACQNPEHLTALVAPPPQDIADEVEAVRERLASVEAAEALGQYKRVGETMPSVLEDALKLDDRALHAEATYWDGRVLQRMRESDKARSSLEQAALHAMASRHDRVLAEALGLLARVVGVLQANEAEGLAIADRAEAAIARIGGDAELTAQLASRRGETLLIAGAAVRARDQFEAAVTQFSALAPGGPQLADSLTNLAAANRALGDLETAASVTARSLALLEQRLGPDHPAVGMALANQASLLNQAGRTDEARASYARARSIFVPRLGKDHVNIAVLDMNRGNLELEAKNIEVARDLLQDVPDQLQAKLPADHPWIAQALMSRGRMWVESGSLASGQTDLRAALEMLEKSSPEASSLAVAQCRYAWALGIGGDAPAAAAGFHRAFTLFERSLGEAADGHPEVQDCQAFHKEIQALP